MVAAWAALGRRVGEGPGDLPSRERRERAGTHVSGVDENTILGMDLVKYLSFTSVLFLLGIWGIFLNRKNVLILLMSIELMLLAVNLNFMVFSVYLDDMMGQLFALLILTVAAAESAIGLAILVITFRIRGTITVDLNNGLKG